MSKRGTELALAKGKKIRAAEDVLKQVKALAAQLKANNEVEKTLTELNLPYNCREVVDKDTEEVLAEIESTLYGVAASILDGEGFSFDIPSRAKGNQAAITSRILGLVHELLGKRIHVTKRDLFYTDVKLFEDQSQSDAILDDLACMLGCTRSSLHGGGQGGERAMSG
ncbi:hypothetical protein GPECTOR_467g385 [Gonium pectorale]|uniref:Spo11/DNA topoisomerase VI subunit A N-terminal domain-containing protein n=1 Tax=Gonium pectorale TaxID=33097 RepID=A0A150FWM3_GONPE|nr:hypothetical protein GPECTOR_467g385 [Gonium pectorale]|eukprot:KXZ41440.1 hypothetical protein GPECTOR_467g385 [Gonium pectorale]